MRLVTECLLLTMVVVAACSSGPAPSASASRAWLRIDGIQRINCAAFGRCAYFAKIDGETDMPETEFMGADQADSGLLVIETRGSLEFPVGRYTLTVTGWSVLEGNEPGDHRGERVLTTCSAPFDVPPNETAIRLVVELLPDRCTIGLIRLLTGARRLTFADAE